jgi:hypothetical protein
MSGWSSGSMTQSTITIVDVAQRFTFNEEGYVSFPVKETVSKKNF